MRPHGLAGAIGGFVALFLILAPPAGAAPTERVVDGGFEATTCADGSRESCTNANWTIDTSSTPRQSFFCSTSVSCGASGPFSGTDWLQFGGTGSGPSGTATGSASQTISIPAAPATIFFNFRYAAGNSAGDTLNVSVDGTQVASLPGASSPTSYTTKSIPIDAAAGSGPKTLTFAFECKGANTFCGTFDVDLVAVFAESDGDGDGVADAADQCPTVAGTAANNGCPAVTPSKACDTAKAKLTKAKAKLKKAKAKVKKAKAAVTKACTA